MAQIFNKTEMAEEILTSDEAKNIYNMVSPIYGNSYVALWIFQAIGKELDIAEQLAEGLFQELRPETATWFLPEWEKRYGIIPGADWTLERRREAVISKRKFNAPVTPEKLSALASSLVGVPVDIIENTGKNKFTVYIRQNTTTEKFDSAREAIDEAKPAYLIYDIVIAEEHVVPVNNYIAVGATPKEYYNVEVS